ncbi:MAG: MoaD family protein [Candidatus Caldarchaeum sp.]|nr:MoaD family protein [Candidatus Caldarchaeum sp.]MDW8062634.1 MoaD family protein [Candidatus Caldarchaeum sp.]
MKVSTRYFAVIRERLGKSLEEFELPDGSTVADFLAAFRKKYSDKVGDLFEASGLRAGFAVALNGENIDPRTWREVSLKDGDVVVILPPIAGGYLKLGSLTPRWP